MRLIALVLALGIAAPAAQAALKPKPWDIKQVLILKNRLDLSVRVATMSIEREATGRGAETLKQDMRQLEREVRDFTLLIDRSTESRDESLAEFTMVIRTYEDALRSFCSSDFDRNVERDFEKLQRDLYGLNAYYDVRTRPNPTLFGHACW